MVVDRIRNVVLVATGMVFLAGAAPLLLAEAKITALAKGPEPLTSSDDVRLLRFADFSEVAQVQEGDILAEGDLLSSVSGQTTVEVTCEDGSLLRFSGGFRVLIDAPTDSSCAVDFLSGSLDVVTDRPTEVNAGGVVLGSEGTHYSVELSRVEGERRTECSVFDGRVRVMSDGLDEPVEAGTAWTLSKGNVRWLRGADLEPVLNRVALRSAKFDLAQAVKMKRATYSEKSLTNLKDLHLAVLRTPADTGKRIALAKQQIMYERKDDAAYNLTQAQINTADKLEDNGIDPRVLRGAKYIRVAPRRPVQDPYALIKQQRYKEAIEVLSAQAKKQADSKVYYGLAIAYAGLEGARSKTANGYAARAQRQNANDKKLSSAQLREVSRIQAAYSRQDIQVRVPVNRPAVIENRRLEGVVTPRRQ